MTELVYITSIPRDYKPHIYPRHLLTKFLQEKHIINRSSYNPTPEEIEILALDLNFIYDQKPSETELLSCLRSYVDKINRPVYFREQLPKSAKRGRIGHLFNSPWKAPPQFWLSSPEICIILEELQRKLVTPPDSENQFPEPLKRALKNLKDNRSIYITKADKGGASVIWDRSEYEREALRQLSDRNTYEEIFQAQHPNLPQKLQDKLEECTDWLLHLKAITNQEAELIKNSAPEIPAIYLLPKVHKKINTVSKTFPGRPVVGTFNCYLHWIDKYLTEITNPLHDKIDNSLVDTIDLIRKLEEFEEPLPHDLKICTLDVEALYPSIDQQRGAWAAGRIYAKFHPLLTELAETNGQLLPPAPNVFETLVNIVLGNSYMHFQEKRLYRQISGTAMGMCISVFVAKAFMYHQIQPILQNPPQHLHAVNIFIDDIFILSTGCDDDIEQMIQLITDDKIKYTSTKLAFEAEMLDLTIMIRDNRFLTKPFSKETASPFYLHAESMHPRATIKSIPYAQLLRLRRNSTLLSDFITPAKKLLKTLRLRGFPENILAEAYNRVLEIPREQLLQRKDKSNNPYSGSIKLIIPFNRSFKTDTIRTSLKELHREIILFYDKANWTDPLKKEPQIVFRNMKKIGSTLTPIFKYGQKDITPTAP
jgi:hypothetical protein